MSQFTFNITAGLIIGPSVSWHAFSGHGEGYNNPDMCDQKGVGPLPPGLYEIGELESEHGVLGPAVMSLTRIDDGPSYGRGSFYIHGAARVNPDMSSDGCIILPRPLRFAMNQIMTKLKDRQLLVVTGI